MHAVAFRLLQIFGALYGLAYLHAVDAVEVDASELRLVAQVGHSNQVKAIATSDRGVIATAGGDGLVKLWHRETGRLLRTMRGPPTIADLTFLGEGARVAAAGSGPGGPIVVWDVATGKEVARIGKSCGDATALSASRSGNMLLALLACDGTQAVAVVFDATSGEEIFRVPEFSWLAAALSQDGAYVAATVGAERGNSIALWEISSRKELRRWDAQLAAPSSFISRLVFAPDGRRLVSIQPMDAMEGDETLKVWEVSDGKRVTHIPPVRQGTRAAQFAGRTPMLGFTTADEIGIVDLDHPESVERKPIPGANFTGLALSPDATQVTFVALLGAVYTLDRRTGATTLVSISDLATNSIGLGKEGILTLTGWGKLGNHLDLWGLNTGEHASLHVDYDDALTERVLRPGTGARGDGTEWRNDEGFSWAAYTGDGQRILVPGDEISLFDLSDGRRAWHGGDSLLNSFQGAQVASTANLVYAFHTNYVAKLYDLRNGTELRAIGALEPGDFVGSMSMSADGNYLGAFLTHAGISSLRIWSAADGQLQRTVPITEAWPGTGKFRVALSGDGQLAAVGMVGGLRIWNTKTGVLVKEIAIDGGIVDSGKLLSGTTLNDVAATTFSSDGRFFAAGDSEGNVRIWSLPGWTEMPTSPAHEGGVINQLQFSENGQLLASAGSDGSAILWDVQTGSWLAKLYSFPDGTWVAVAPDGRFDTNELEENKWLHWVASNDGLQPLSFEIFMKDYYEPRLLSRIVNREPFKPIRSLGALNRVQPDVRITAVQAVAGHPELADVTVEVSGVGRRFGTSNKVITSAAHDLRLFRNGQLVGYRDGKLAEAGKSPARTTFRVRLPDAMSEFKFVAYAFNDDRVKSSNSRWDYTRVDPAPLAKPRAWVVTIGVNRHDNSAWNLRYAANDARRINESVVKRLQAQGHYLDVIAIPLVSDGESQLATKATIKAVLDRLAGREVPEALLAAVPGAERLRPAAPDDLLIISFSGHGGTHEGQFYLIPADTGPGKERTASPELFMHAISSDELAAWLRDVDGGDVAMIIDACQSAASVGGEFKPGPMGARGLGQLAYEKGMRLLAASQAEEDALESELTQQGLLSYALANDGLEQRRADYQPKDGRITMGEWLSYAMRRVPGLAKEVASGTLDVLGSNGHAGTPVLGRPQTRTAPQQPALFDFAKGRPDATVADMR